MANLNRVYLMGNLTRDPEIRYTPGGRAVGDLRLAVNRTFQTADGERRDETCYVSIVVWGRQAETCGEYLRKGSPVLVEGRLQYDEWEKEGQKFNRLRVVANRVQFLGSPRGAEYQDGGASATRSDQAAPQSGASATRSDQVAPQSGESPSPGPGGGDINDTGDDDNLPF